MLYQTRRVQCRERVLLTGKSGKVKIPNTTLPIGHANPSPYSSNSSLHPPGATKEDIFPTTAASPNLPVSDAVAAAAAPSTPQTTTDPATGAPVPTANLLNSRGARCDPKRVVMDLSCATCSSPCATQNKGASPSRRSKQAHQGSRHKSTHSGNADRSPSKEGFAGLPFSRTAIPPLPFSRRTAENHFSLT